MIRIDAPRLRQHVRNKQVKIVIGKGLGRVRPAVGLAGTQNAEHGVDIEFQTRLQRFLRHKVKAEDDLARKAVVEVVIADRRERQMQLTRIYARPKIATVDATVDYVLKHVDESAVKFMKALRLFHMTRPVQILAVHQGHEFRMFEVVLPRESHQRADRVDRRKMVKLQFRFRSADVCPCVFQHYLEELLLSFEVFVDHALVDASLCRNRIDPGAAKANL